MHNVMLRDGDAVFPHTGGEDLSGHIRRRTRLITRTSPVLCPRRMRRQLSADRPDPYGDRRVDVALRPDLDRLFLAVRASAGELRLTLARALSCFSNF
jgi:hypothetical protein